MCDCTPDLIKGIVYGLGLAVILFTVTFLIADTIAERGNR